MLQSVSTEAGPFDAFLRKITWDGDSAAGWRPHNDPASPVQSTPSCATARSAVGGTSTEVIREHDEAGEDPEDIVDDFGLTVEQIR